MKDGTTRCATGASCRVKEPREYAKAFRERHRLTAGDSSFDDALSPAVAEMLIIALTVLLAALLLSTLLGYCTIQLPSPEPPELLKIIDISHYNKTGGITYAGVVQLKNIGSAPLNNNNHGAHVYVNENKKRIIIETLNSSAFIPTHHFGIKLIRGAGPRDEWWPVGNTGFFDIADEFILPGDVVRFDIYNTTTGRVISRSRMTAPEI